MGNIWRFGRVSAPGSLNVFNFQRRTDVCQCDVGTDPGAITQEHFRALWRQMRQFLEMWEDPWAVG
jgi:hypothetical protein